MNEPFFSIVTVVRNNLAGLKKTQSSVVEQLNASWEWIIVDGCSNDGTSEFAATCVAANVSVTREPDLGVYDAMNKGLRRSSGQYVIFMNSGDAFAGPDVLRSVQDELTRAPVDVLFGASILRFGLMDVMRPARDPGYIWHGQPGTHQATLFSRAKHALYPYDLSYRICGDYDVITRMWAAGLTFNSTQILMSVNEYTAGGISGRRKFALIEEAVRAQRNNLRLPLWKIAISVAYRIFTSVSAKILTLLDVARSSLGRNGKSAPTA
jgi:putative colanic acid biosynthesis glycosyltransferase